VVSRAAEGLPLPPTDTTNEILRGIYGRALREGQVTLCNFVEMNNHSHTHAIPARPGALPKVYGEIKKDITEAVKALMGMERLGLWEKRSLVALMPRLEDVIARIVYMFCNPTKANLVDSIDDYPGLSSWKAFKSCPPSVDAVVSMPVRFYLKSAIPRLPESNSLTKEEDREYTEALRSSQDVHEEVLQIEPFAWLKSFGVTDRRRIEKIRRRIIEEVYAREEKYRKARILPVIGAEALRRQDYLKPHTPQKRERKLFVFCRDPDLRMKIITMVQAITATCQACYEKAKKGLPVEWPEGVFLPWLPPRQFCVLPP